MGARSIVALVAVLNVALAILGPANAQQEHAAPGTGAPYPPGEEIKGLRTEYSRTTYSEDGEFQVVIQNSPIHYLDADGDWARIDNTLCAFVSARLRL